MAGAISKSEIRRNPLAEWLALTVRFVQTHRTSLLSALVVAAVLGVSGGGYWWYQEQREADAARTLARAYAVLRGERTGKPEVPEEAAKRFREIAEQYRGTRSAEEALIALGNLHYDANKVSQALTSYEEYLTGYPRGRFRTMAALGKAYGQEAKGDLQGAAETLSEALGREKDNPLAGEVQVTLARIYEGLEKPEDAMRAYGQVAERFPNTNWAQDALQRMTILGTKAK